MKNYFESGYVAAWEKIAATRGIKKLRSQLSPEDAAEYQRLVANKEDTGKLWSAIGERRGTESSGPGGQTFRHKLLGVGPRYNLPDSPENAPKLISEEPVIMPGVQYIRNAKGEVIPDPAKPVRPLAASRDAGRLYQPDPLAKKPAYGAPAALWDRVGSRHDPRRLITPAPPGSAPHDYDPTELHARLTANMMRHHNARLEAAGNAAEAALASGAMGADPTAHPQFKDTMLGRLMNPPASIPKPEFSSHITKSISERLRGDPALKQELARAPTPSVRQLPPDQRPPGALPPGTPPRNKNVLQLTNVVKPGLPPSQWKAPR